MYTRTQLAMDVLAPGASVSRCTKHLTTKRFDLVYSLEVGEIHTDAHTDIHTHTERER